jgi:hypothetical protein
MDKNDLPKKIRAALLKAIHSGEFIPIPSEREFNGDGGPGVLLERLAGVPLRRSRGKDQPDFDEGFELKYHGGSNLITMYHKTAKPAGIMKLVTKQFGKPYDAPDHGSDCVSLAHAVNINGFQLQDTDDKIVIDHPDRAYPTNPFFTHDTLVNTWAQKAQRLIVIEGTLRKESTQRSVRYERLHVYTELRNKKIIPLLLDGVIVIEFDARWRPNSEILKYRDHGTKIRINVENLPLLYAEVNEIVR